MTSPRPLHPSPADVSDEPGGRLRVPLRARPTIPPLAAPILPLAGLGRLAPPPDHVQPRQHAGEQRQAEVQDDALGHDPDVEVDVPDEQPRVDRDEQHLGDRVERHEHQRHRGIPLGEEREDDDHRDARRQAVEDEARVELGGGHAAVAAGASAADDGAAGAAPTPVAAEIGAKVERALRKVWEA